MLFSSARKYNWFQRSNKRYLDKELSIQFDSYVKADFYGIALWSSREDDTQTYSYNYSRQISNWNDIVRKIIGIFRFNDRDSLEFYVVNSKGDGQQFIKIKTRIY